MIEVTIRFLAVIGLFTCVLGGMAILAVSIWWYQSHIKDRFLAACQMRNVIAENKIKGEENGKQKM